MRCEKNGGYVFAMLGDMVARARTQGVTLREVHLDMLRKCKMTLVYSGQAHPVARVVKSVRAVAAKKE